MPSKGPSRPYNRRPESLAKLKLSLSLTDQSQLSGELIAQSGSCENTQGGTRTGLAFFGAGCRDGEVPV